jgi:hypothetical protein
MIRILDQVVADWVPYVWAHDGALVEQVQVHLYNGMTLVMDYDDFMVMADDEGS